MLHNDTIPEKAQEKIKKRNGRVQRYLTKAELRGIISSELSAALRKDAEDLLQDFFITMHFPIESATAITPNEWRALIEDAREAGLFELEAIEEEYKAMPDYMALPLEDLYKLKPGNHACAIFAVYDYRYKPTWKDEEGQPKRGDELVKETRRSHNRDKWQERGKMQRHLAFFYTILQHLRIAKRDAKGIIPMDCPKDMAFFMDVLNLSIIKDISKFNSIDDAATTQTITLPASEQLVRIWQNSSDFLSKPLKSADKNDEGAELQPLLSRLEEQQKIGGIKKTISEHYVTQAFRGATIIPSLLKPYDEGKLLTTYKLTLGELTKICTGQDRPNPLTLEKMWDTFDWISTQRFDFIENIVPSRKMTRYYKQRDDLLKAGESEKAAKLKIPKAKPTAIRLNAIVAEFVNEIERDKRVKSATSEVFLQLNNVIAKGRRQEQVELTDEETGKGYKANILPPVPHLTTAQQLYAFTSDEAIRFFNTLLSKSHQNEADLLANIFQYREKIEHREKQVKEATKALNRKGLTDDEKATYTLALEGARQALQDEKTNISKHKGRDRKKLQGFFEQAENTGVITSSNRRKGQKDYVWEWARPKKINK